MLKQTWLHADTILHFREQIGLPRSASSIRPLQCPQPEKETTHHVNLGTLDMDSFNQDGEYQKKKH